MKSSSRIAPIQRGTSRPLGKSTRNIAREAFLRKLTKPKGNASAGEGRVSGPLNSTRNKAASSANQSSDLRQNRRKPTAYQITSMSTKKTVSTPAYVLAEKPLAVSEGSTWGGSA